MILELFAHQHSQQLIALMKRKKCLTTDCQVFSYDKRWSRPPSPIIESWSSFRRKFGVVRRVWWWLRKYYVNLLNSKKGKQIYPRGRVGKAGRSAWAGAPERTRSPSFNKTYGCWAVHGVFPRWWKGLLQWPAYLRTFPPPHTFHTLSSTEMCASSLLPSSRLCLLPKCFGSIWNETKTKKKLVLARLG